MRLLESGEMHLETILVRSQKKSMVRSPDVAEYMGLSTLSKEPFERIKKLINKDFD